MAAALTITTVTGIARWGAGLALGAALLLSPARAELPDPTRPPPALSVDAGGEALQPALRVTSVFLMGKRPYAIVDDLTVRVGDPLADGKVRAIDERGVWLATPAGKRLLPLVPGMDKRMAGKNNPLEKKR